MLRIPWPPGRGVDDQGGRMPPWRSIRFWGQVGLTYAVALAAGAVASSVGVPLPWMLGPFFVCGLLTATGLPLVALPLTREFAQLAVGLAIGLRFTPATLVATLALLPAMLAATVYVMFYTMVAGLLMRPLAGISSTTAFFATAAGGVADMAIVAREKGGDSAAVAMVHALRVSTTVALVPILVVTFGRSGDVEPALAGDDHGPVALVLAFLLAFGAAWLLRRTMLPNPWLVGPMFLGVALGATGAMRLAVPPAVIALAQLLLGAWLGCRFQREVLVTLPRTAVTGVLISVFMVAAAFLGAVAMAALTAMPVSTAFLALAPAAVTEMVITAKTMHLDAEVVTAFHIMRIFLVCSTILVVYRIYRRLGGETGPGS